MGDVQISGKEICGSSEGMTVRVQRTEAYIGGRVPTSKITMLVKTRLEPVSVFNNLVDGLVYFLFAREKVLIVQ
ncbi:MAG: hypothetical protein IPH31_18060 [Lewinellaceae bacterium]|nr:hypothetical protein [Lewinellaceae bacterium]